MINHATEHELIEPLKNDECVLYLVRHGATPPNLVSPPIIQGAGIDEPLAPLGRAQADRVGASLSGVGLSAVYSSPLQRALETAQAIAAPHALRVEPIAALKEVEVGHWQGLDWDVIRRDDPDGYARFHSNPAINGYPGGETLQGLLDRVAPALEALMARHLGQQIAAVAHSVVNRVYMGALVGVPLQNVYPLRQDNCCVNVVRWRNGAAQCVTINAVHHLA
ncbi:histidine phosphatase family protein [Botrimarina hoheduenensis]|uniref:Phosphoserine phosphatase 1 n=1 Tax=Botrimarina hoheduenensis TaxID=2528000 RepID=A0A5C5VVB5_9BACT|nr:histidine phosphatase family protein [Botrimarina hoheduenensis]TWT41551.1 Phosphoserine phosphatase 1 [Botrimarina hoheduenensis]